MSDVLTVYHYPKCSSCKDALAFLRKNEVCFEAIDISQRPPTKQELREMISRQGAIRPLFNTSGKSYREGGFSEKVASMSEDEAVEALSRDGMLVKRPFVLTKDHGLLGFKVEQWSSCFAPLPRRSLQPA
jgi:arsenate reductase